MRKAASWQAQGVVRAFLVLLVCTSASAGCTTQARMLHIGVMNLSPLLVPVFEGFKQGMAAFGYREGLNVKYTYLEAGTIDKLDSLAAAFLAPDIDLILAISTPAAQAAKRVAGERKRIVFASVLDPLGAGIVESIRQPGGNITGIRHGVHEAKRFEWLLRTKPDIQRVYVPFNPNDRAAVINLDIVKKVAELYSVQIVERACPDDAAVTAALVEMPDAVDAIHVLADNLIASRLVNGTPNFLSVSLERKLPMSVPIISQVAQGGLIAFAFDFVSLGRQAARLVDQVLRGVRPGDLPVETVEFELAINVGTAQAIGLVLPDELLEQADRIFYGNPSVIRSPEAPRPTAAPTLVPSPAATERTF
jgi:putative ABC transport system substrate-binding protein